MENQMEKHMENEMETRDYCGYLLRVCLEYIGIYVEIPLS